MFFYIKGKFKAMYTGTYIQKFYLKYSLNRIQNICHNLKLKYLNMMELKLHFVMVLLLTGF